MQDRVLVVVIDGLGFDPEAERKVMQSVRAQLSAELEAGLRRQLADLLAGRPQWAGVDLDQLLTAVLAPVLPSGLVMSAVGPEIAADFKRVWRAFRTPTADNTYSDQAPRIERLVHDCASAVDYKIWSAQTPNLNELRNAYPTWITRTSGVDAGFPDIQPRVQGNSEAGHQQIMNLSVAFQPPMEISQALVSGAFARSDQVNGIREHLEAHASNLIVSTLLSGDCGSDGQVHSSWDHLEGFLDVAFGTLKLSKDRVRIQAILDGRDSPPRSAGTIFEDHPPFLTKLLDFLSQWDAQECLAWIIGRSIAMDRDFDQRNALTDYNLLVQAQGQVVDGFSDVLPAMQRCYGNGLDDSSIPGLVVLDRNGQARRLGGGDVFVDLNYRADRQRQRIAVLLGKGEYLKAEATTRGKSYDTSWIQPPSDLLIVTMTEYHPALGPDAGVVVLFPQRPSDQNILAIMPELYDDFHYLLVAESNKSLHVGFFLRGRREEPVRSNCETRIIVPSYRSERHVESDDDYYKTPQMKAFVIEGVLQNELIGDVYDLAVVNFSNADMVGHLAPRHPREAALALEYVDDAVGEVVAAARKLGWSILVTADHGNIEDAGSSHTNNDVFTSLVSEQPVEESADAATPTRLCDVAWTVLELLGTREAVESAAAAGLQRSAREFVGQPLVRRARGARSKTGGA
jgi:2,3-bisphosphoglycerate-independent phosphoglycerate mutase